MESMKGDLMALHVAQNPFIKHETRTIGTSNSHVIKLLLCSGRPQNSGLIKSEIFSVS